MQGKSGEGGGLGWKNGASLEGLTDNCLFEYCSDDIEFVLSLSSMLLLILKMNAVEKWKHSQK
jgi:hypothetical protein